MLMVITQLYALLTIGCSLLGLCSSDELLTFLTQENGAYKVYYSQNGQAWSSYPVPAEIANVEDVEFNHVKKAFYFSSTTNIKKGLWKTNMNMTGQTFTHQLRDDSSPMTMIAYPEFEVMLFYDSGYSLVIEISLENEVTDMRIKSLFATTERLDGAFFFDPTSNRVFVQQANDTQGILLTSMLNGTFLTNTRFPARAGNKANGMAYDPATGVLFYCSDGYINAMRLSESIIYQTLIKLPCTRIAAKDSNTYYVDTISGFVQKISFTSAGVTVLNNTYLKLPFTVSQATRLISFKYYSYDPNNAQNYCSEVDCSQICLPADTSKTAKCVCMDYYSISNSPIATPDDPCKKDSLHGPGIFYATYNISYARDATLFYRLGGDPNVWTRRPQREQLFTISSDVAAVAYDWKNQRIFAAALRYRQIMSAGMDGAFATQGHYSGISNNIKTMAYDWVGNNIMWFDPNFRWLRIVPLSTRPTFSSAATYKTVRVAAHVAGYALRLDAIAGYLFFLEHDDREIKISLWRSLMDGSEATKLYTFPSNVFSDSLLDSTPEIPFPGALNIDFTNKHVWIAFTKQMFVINYGGQLVYTTTIGTDELTIYNSRVAALALYSMSYAVVAVTRTDTGLTTLFAYAIVRKSDGSCCNSLINVYNKPIYGLLRAMIDYEEEPTPPASLNCTTLNCSNICLNIKGTLTCICPDGFTYDSGAKTCNKNPFDPLGNPTVVFTASDKACHRSLTDQTNWNGRNLFGPTDNCTSIGFVSSPLDSPRAIDADPISFKAYIILLQSNPRQVFSVNLTAATKGAYQYNFYSTLGQLVGSNMTAYSTEVFYEAVTTNSTGGADLAFDFLGRNLYIGDQSNGRLLLVRDDFTSPLILAQNINFTALTIDPLRRKLYWAVGSSGGGTTIVQRDLDGTSNECLVGKVSENVIEMRISHTNQTLLFLAQPSNKIGRVELRRLPPFVGCPSTPPQIFYTTLAKPNVTNFAIYQSMLLFTCGASDGNQADANNCANKIFASSTGGQTIDSDVTVFQPSRSVFITALAVFDPAVVILTNRSYAVNDKCASMNRGRCEQFCLSSWDLRQNLTNAKCNCPDGMRLLNDALTCSARASDIANDGIVFTPDDYRHDIYSVPLKALDGATANIEDILTTYKVHQRARPYAVAYDPVSDYLYYSDFERWSIYRISPKRQMTRTAEMIPFNELFLNFTQGSRPYGLFVDSVSHLLYYTIRDNRMLYVIDTLTKKGATVINFADMGANVFGVIIDRRVDKMHLYVSLRNNSQILQMSNFSTGTSGRVILQIKNNPMTWSSIIRCATDGTNCSHIVMFNATGPDEVQTVPWIYDMAIDYTTNKLYFTTGQNRSIMYLDLDNLNSGPKNFYTSSESASFLYGVQVYGDKILATDWGRGGIHVLDKKTGVRKTTLGGQFMIGINGLALYSRSAESSLQLNRACENSKLCSHVCVPLAGGRTKCLCPDGVPTIDGVNCPGTTTCTRPAGTVGIFDDNCDYRTDSSCTLTCADSTSVNPAVRLTKYLVTCVRVTASTSKWCANVTDLCPPVNVAQNAADLAKCPRPTIPQAIIDGSSSDNSLNGGAIAGIVIACIVFVAILVAVGFFLYKRYYVAEIQHERFDLPPGSIHPASGAGLPHMDELGMPDAFRYRNLAETHDQIVASTS